MSRVNRRMFIRISRFARSTTDVETPSTSGSPIVKAVLALMQVVGGEYRRSGEESRSEANVFTRLRVVDVVAECLADRLNVHRVTVRGQLGVCAAESCGGYLEG